MPSNGFKGRIARIGALGRTSWACARVDSGEALNEHSHFPSSFELGSGEGIASSGQHEVALGLASCMPHALPQLPVAHASEVTTLFVVANPTRHAKSSLSTMKARGVLRNSTLILTQPDLPGFLRCRFKLLSELHDDPLALRMRLAPHDLIAQAQVQAEIVDHHLAGREADFGIALVRRHTVDVLQHHRRNAKAAVFGQRGQPAAVNVVASVRIACRADGHALGKGQNRATLCRSGGNIVEGFVQGSRGRLQHAAVFLKRPQHDLKDYRELFLGGVANLDHEANFTIASQGHPQMRSGGETTAASCRPPSEKGGER